jgi:hypothetical protein
MIPLLLGLLGAGAIIAAAWLLRGIGPRYRIGRLLAGAPGVSLEEAVAMATDGRSGYVRLHGRITSDEEFPDEHDRPLVYRRRRVQVLERGRWQDLVDDREAVPFGIEQRGTFVAVDATALEDGLVVIPREAEGVAADLPAELSAGLDQAAPSRLVIEQVSAVEHAFVAGVPARRGDETVIGGGLGRPLVLTTLELDAAMRVLARSHRRRVVAVIGLLATAVALLLVAGGAWLAGVS